MLLTQSRLKELVAYDPETGIFTRLVRTANSTRVGDIAGGVMAIGYRIIKIDGRPYRAHRLAWLYMTGDWPVDGMDHINGARDDNRISNLREATQTQNGQNQAIHCNNKCGFMGVDWHRASGKWRSQIGFEGRLKHLGLFDSPDDAHAAYVAAKAEMHTFQPTMRG